MSEDDEWDRIVADAIIRGTGFINVSESGIKHFPFQDGIKVGVKPSERLKEIEESLSRLREDSVFSLSQEDGRWLLARVKKLTEALERISGDIEGAETSCDSSSRKYNCMFVAEKALEE